MFRIRERFRLWFIRRFAAAAIQVQGIDIMINLLTQIHSEVKNMSTVPAGLQALETQVAALTTAVQGLAEIVSSSVAAIQTAISEAGEDATVVSIATEIGRQIGNINAAVDSLKGATTPAPAAASTTVVPAQNENAGALTPATESQPPAGGEQTQKPTGGTSPTEPPADTQQGS